MKSFIFLTFFCYTPSLLLHEHCFSICSKIKQSLGAAGIIVECGEGLWAQPAVLVSASDFGHLAA